MSRQRKINAFTIDPILLSSEVELFLLSSCCLLLRLNHSPFRLRLPPNRAAVCMAARRSTSDTWNDIWESNEWRLPPHLFRFNADSIDTLPNHITHSLHTLPSRHLDFWPCRFAVQALPLFIVFERRMAFAAPVTKVYNPIQTQIWKCGKDKDK